METKEMMVLYVDKEKALKEALKARDALLEDLTYGRAQATPAFLHKLKQAHKLVKTLER